MGVNLRSICTAPVGVSSPACGQHPTTNSASGLSWQNFFGSLLCQVQGKLEVFTRGNR